MEEVVGRGGRRRRTRTEGRQETGERSIVESDGYRRAPCQHARGEV